MSLLVPAAVYPIVASKAIEVMAHPINDVDGALGAVDVGELQEQWLSRADALVIGPGLGTSAATVDTVTRILQATACPTVVDADGLNCAVNAKFEWRTLKQPTVITPHLGEMSRLTGKSTEEISSNPEAVASAFARDNSVVVVLKSAITIIAAPDGRVHRHDHPLVTLATGGTGDVLAGLVGSMLAQGLEPYDSAIAAVNIHAEAGAAVLHQRGRAGGLATDVLEELPAAQERQRRFLERHHG